jgi:hypothetical protein
MQKIHKCNRLLGVGRKKHCSETFGNKTAGRGIYFYHGLEKSLPAGAVQGKGTGEKYRKAVLFTVIQDLFP